MSEQQNGSESDYPLELSVPVSEELQKLKDHFVSKYHEEPEFYVRVPGRVNLIGEHIDYCGYSVCPMAIQQHILVAAKRNTSDTLLHLTNVDDRYSDYQCDVTSLRVEVSGAPKWYQYFECGVKGIIETLDDDQVACGFYAAVNGNIPPRSGLSSSSALVCAAVLSAAKIHQLKKTKTHLSELAATSERYIGTQGGGMDQAIAFLATEGCAKLISFSPLKSENIELPGDPVFVIANSLVEMNKAATADFNRRVVECRLACYIFAKRLQLHWRSYTKLADLQAKIGIGVRHLQALAMETLHEKPYTKKEICRELMISEEELDKTCLTENTKNLQEFKLKQRVMHVFQEVARVQEFVQACKDYQSGKKDVSQATWKLGDLMKQSHKSLQTLYECSHEELNKITELGHQLALGVRLTGAGWGGCTVAYVRKDKAQEYIDTLKEKFYKDNPAAGDRNIDELVFKTQPGISAVIYVPV